MDKAIIEHLTKVLHSQVGEFLPLSSLGSYIDGLNKKRRNRIKSIGFEKFLIKHPDNFAILDGMVLLVQNLAGDSNETSTHQNRVGNQIFISKFKPPSAAAIESIKKDVQKSNSCMVCSDEMEIYAYGICFHPICYRCSTKLRVLCNDKQCPVCRLDLKQICFSNKLQPLNENNTTSFIKEQKYGLCFETSRIRNLYRRLLEHTCEVDGCNKKFDDFDDLQEHLKLKHGEYFCEICVKQCKIFTFERKTYSTSELKAHQETGDTGDGSAHNGHPLCQFCNCRYLDDDELLRHLQQHHSSCHICVFEKHVFYPDQNALWHHHQEEHFACKEVSCFGNTNCIFKSLEELTVHETKFHEGKKTRSMKRQQQRIDLKVTYGSEGGLQFGAHRKVELPRIMPPLTRASEKDGVFCTGIVLTTTSYYGFIERDVPCRSFSDNIFFNQASCDLEPDDDLSSYVMPGERVYVRVVPTANHRSNWRALTVVKLSDMNKHKLVTNSSNCSPNRLRHYSVSSDLTSSELSDIGSAMEDSFPALTTNSVSLEKVQDGELTTTSWSKVVGSKKSRSNVEMASKSKTTNWIKPSCVLNANPLEGIGTIHSNFQPSFGFITKGSNAFRDNIYFNLKAYQLGMKKVGVTNLTKELKIGDKVNYILEKSDINQGKPSAKFRAAKVWKCGYNPDTDGDDVALNNDSLSTNDETRAVVTLNEKTGDKNISNYGIGVIYSNLQGGYGFIEVEGCLSSKDNIFFNTRAYELGMGKQNIKDLREELCCNMKVGYVLADASENRKNASSKYKAKLVWKFGHKPGETLPTSSVILSDWVPAGKSETYPVQSESRQTARDLEIVQSEENRHNSVEDTMSDVLSTSIYSDEPYCSASNFEIFRLMFVSCMGGNFVQTLSELNTKLKVNGYPHLGYISFVQFFCDKPPRIFLVQVENDLADEKQFSSMRKWFDLTQPGLNKFVSSALTAQGRATIVTENVLTINETKMYIILNRNEKEEVKEISLHTGFGFNASSFVARY